MIITPIQLAQALYFRSRYAKPRRAATPTPRKAESSQSARNASVGCNAPRWLAGRQR